MKKVKSDLFNFDDLKLVEKPAADRNTGRLLAQNLEGCEGYLKALPLKAPNVDQKVPKTIADMVNILTVGGAEAKFDTLQLEQTAPEDRREGAPSSIYNLQTSPVMKKLTSDVKTSHASAPGMLGHVVNPGCASFYVKDGKTFAAPQGRWFLSSYKAKWIAKNIALDNDQIHLGDISQVLIIRVPPGGVGRIFDQGVPILLDVGTHVFNSGTIKNAGTMLYAENNYFRHGKYNYVRVTRGNYAKVWVEQTGRHGVKSLVPRLLAEGEHFIESHLFTTDGLCRVDDKCIHHGTLHLISVQKGYVDKIIQDNFPRLLGEGDHVIESTQFQYNGSESIVEHSVIVHGTITILRVNLGQIALAWKDSEPVFIDKPGLYEWDSADFRFVEFKDAEEQLIQLGSRKIVLVHTGLVGVTYDQGALKILDHGRHMIDSATHVFHRFLSTQQKSIRLVSVTASEKANRATGTDKKSFSQNMSHKSSEESKKSRAAIPNLDSDLTICETKDLVKVGLRADVFYSIEDPEKCINKIDTDELEDLVRETAVATLTNIIRSTALNEIAQSKQVSAGGIAGGLTVLPPAPGGPGEEQGPAPSMSAFFEKAHDDFLDKLHDDFMFRYGVDIANIRIESFKIMDTELSDQISKHALTTAQIENEMANLEGNSLISTTRGRTEAAVKNIIMDAENERKIQAAQAEAESLKIQARAIAEAEAESILTKAKAEAEAIRLKAAAEAERAELLSKTNLGMQEALLRIYSDIVIESNRGVEKVIYMDPSVNRESPFAIGSLQNLNNDLHSLTHLGIAAGEAGGNGNGGNGNGGKNASS